MFTVAHSLRERAARFSAAATFALLGFADVPDLLAPAEAAPVGVVRIAAGVRTASITAATANLERTWEEHISRV